MRCRPIFEINVGIGLLSTALTADNYVPVARGCANGAKLDMGTVASRVDPQGFAEMTSVTKTAYSCINPEQQLSATGLYTVR